MYSYIVSANSRADQQISTDSKPTEKPWALRATTLICLVLLTVLTFCAGRPCASGSDLRRCGSLSALRGDAFCCASQPGLPRQSFSSLDRPQSRCHRSHSVVSPVALHSLQSTSRLQTHKDALTGPENFHRIVANHPLKTSRLMAVACDLSPASAIASSSAEHGSFHQSGLRISSWILGTDALLNVFGGSPYAVSLAALYFV